MPISFSFIMSVLWETQCTYVDTTLKSYIDWLGGTCDPENPLRPYNRDRFWCYVDYKHMQELFSETQAVLQVG